MSQGYSQAHGSRGFELLERRDRKGELLCGPVRVPGCMIPRRALPFAVLPEENYEWSGSVDCVVTL